MRPSAFTKLPEVSVKGEIGSMTSTQSCAAERKDVSATAKPADFNDASARAPLSLSSVRSEEHTSELQSLMRISYAVFCLKKNTHSHHQSTSQLSSHHP